jgi:hypothetical protein
MFPGIFIYVSSSLNSGFSGILITRLESGWLNQYSNRLEGKDSIPGNARFSLLYGAQTNSEA